MDKKLIFGIIAVVIVLGTAFWYYNSTKPALEESQIPSPNSSETTMNHDQNMTGATGTDSSTSSAGSANIKEVMVGGSNYKFEPSQIKVKLGDTVKVRFMNTQGTHNFTIDGLNTKTNTISSGQEETIEFTASEVGNFEYYCSVGNHKEQGMVGSLVVE